MVAVIAVHLSFEALVLPQRGAVLGYALNLCRGNKAQAEDICQEVLVRAIEAWSRLQVPPNADPERIVRAWLFTITYNHFVNTWRRGKRSREAAEDFRHQVMEGTYGTSNDGEDPRDQLVSGYSDEVTTALSVLDKDQRAVVDLATAGFAYKEIAKELGIPMGTVMSRLCRARRKLEAQLTGYAGLNYGLRRNDVEDATTLEAPESPETETDSIDGVMGGDDSDEFVGAEPFADSDPTW